jgi:lysozyme family protein
MKADQAECLERVLVSEGGYSNHPADPGGPTNWGITIADARRYWKPGATASDVRAMPKAIAMGIYQDKYWDALNCDALPAGLDYSLFDYGVNSGIARAGKVLRRIVGVADADWQVTDAVLAAIAKRDAKTIIAALDDERLTFLRSLKTWPVFGAGWGARVSAVKAASLNMAANAPRAPSSPQTSAKGHVPSPKGTRAVVAAGGAAVATGGGGLLSWLGAHPFDAWISAVGVIALIGVVLAVVHQVHQARQMAPTPNSPAVPAPAAA